MECEWTNMPSLPSTGGEKKKTKEFKMPSGNNTQILYEEDHYIYLTIPQANNIKHTEVKKKVSELYHENEEDFEGQTQW